jgi:Tfp pilus assembly protein PilX
MILVFQKPKEVKGDQKGFAAIVIVLTLVLVLSLITLGFASLIRREQRTATDNQLSTQAFYAAESGINDAVKAIKDGTVTTDITTNCGQGSVLPTPQDVGTGTGAKYTCLLVDLAPRSMEFNPVTTSLSKVVQFSTEDNSGSPAAASSLLISWQDASGSTSFPGTYPNFPTVAAWGNNTPVLRISLTPLTALDRSSLTNNTYTVFLYPRPAGAGATGAATYIGGAAQLRNQGQNIPGLCNAGSTPHYCRAQINGLPGATKYLLRIKSIYRDSEVTVTATDPATGSAMRIKGAQAVVDSTGKAQDVLRRIQVRVPILNDFNFPEYVLEAGNDICKRFTNDGTTITELPPCTGTNSVLGAATAAGAGAGTADIGGCVTGHPCTGAQTGSSGKYEYTIEMINKSAPPTGGLTVTGCTWVFDDGTPTITLPPGQCDFDDSFNHTFPSIDEATYPFPSACNFATSSKPPRKDYKVVLTQKFSNGTTANKTQFIVMPYCP